MDNWNGLRIVLWSGHECLVMFWEQMSSFGDSKLEPLTKDAVLIVLEYKPYGLKPMSYWESNISQKHFISKYQRCILKPSMENS